MGLSRKRYPEDPKNVQRIKQLLTNINQNQLQDSLNTVHLLRPITKIETSMFLLKTPESLEGDEEYSCNTSYILSVEGYGRLAWDLLVMIAMLLQSFYIPFLIGFEIPMRGNLMYLDFMITVAFLIDIVASFNTTFYKSGSLVKNRRDIALNYIKGWFWIDLLASFPYDWVIERSILIEDTNSYESAVFQPGFQPYKLMRMIQIFRLFRMVKLIRLVKLKRILFKIEELLYNELLASLFVYAKLCIVVFFIAHWTACVWFFVSCHSLTSVSESWLMDRESIYGYRSNLLENYVTSLYWAITTMTTIGYGDINPHSVNERIFTMVSMCIGCGFFSFIVGNVSSLISSHNPKSRNHRETFVSVNKFMSKKSLPYELQFKVRRYLDYLFEYHIQSDLVEHQILDMLSEPLRDEIYLCTYGKILISYNIFPLLFSSTIIAQLTKLLTPETFAPGDIVIEEGKRDRQINFLISGNVNIFHMESNSLLKNLNKGTYFGEIGFFADHKRTASAKCMSFTELLVLDYKQTVKELEKYPRAIEALNSIEMKCKNRDYSELYIKCYLCKNKGHVALKCQTILLNLDIENAKQKWLAAKKVQGKVINPYDDITPNFNRKPRHINQHPNFIHKTAQDKDLDQLYHPNSALITKIHDFHSKSIDVNNSLSIYPNPIMRYESSESIRIVDIYSQSEEEVEDKSPIMKFDRSLICLDSAFKSCRSEGDIDLIRENEVNKDFFLHKTCSMNPDVSNTSLKHQNHFILSNSEKAKLMK